MKKKVRFIDLYYEWMEKGELPQSGLCFSLPEELMGIFSFFEPTDDDLVVLCEEGMIRFVSASTMWGSGLRFGEPGRDEGFTPLRQTLILFCAALNNEL